MWPFKRGLSDKDWLVLFGNLWPRAQDAASYVASEIQEWASKVGAEPPDLEFNAPVSSLPADLLDRWDKFSIRSSVFREIMELIDSYCRFWAEKRGLLDPQDGFAAGVWVKGALDRQEAFTAVVGIEWILRKTAPRNEAYREIHDTFHCLILRQCSASLMWPFALAPADPRTGQEEIDSLMEDLARRWAARTKYDWREAARLMGRLKRLAVALPESDPIRLIVTG